MGITFEDRTVELKSGEMIVVKKGEKHRPFSDEECKVLLIEPKGVVNTGDAGGDLTASNNEWV
jgi:mannose-6-phosphate isomerase-like protein (cupin superfamily)